MSGFVIILLIGATAGVVLTVIDRLVAPVVHGWFMKPARTASGEPVPEPRASLSTRVRDDLITIVLIAGAILTLSFAGLL